MDASSLDRLLHESAWLRRLARHLVSDPDAAEDVAQETWLAAARVGRPPSRRWLAVVARRLASRTRRGNRRRQERERIAARDDDGGEVPGDELVERLELARRVARELQRLPEPYRRTLYQRYYEDLSAELVAEREGVAAGTVRWRAKRGRELLREALVRRGEAWESWVLALGPFLSTPAAPVAGTLSGLGGLAMTVTWSVAGAVAGALAATGIWLVRDPAQAPREDLGSPVARERPQLRPDASAPRERGATAAGERRPAEETAAPDEAFGVIGFGRVTDGTGAPVPDATPVLEDGAARLATATSGPDGGWSLAGLEPGPHELTVEVDGHVPHRERVEVPVARSWRHDVTLRPGLQIPARFEDPDGEAIPARWAGDLGTFLGVVATLGRPGSRVPGVHGRQVSRHGVGRYVARVDHATPNDLDSRYQGILHVNAAAPVWVGLAYRDVVVETRSLSGSEEELVFAVDPDALRATHGEVRVQLVDAGGAPLGVLPELRHPSGSIRVRGELEGAETVYRDVPPGLLDLRLDREPDVETLNREVRVPPGETLDLGTIRLGRPVPFRVRTVDPSGAPLSLSVRAVRPELTAGVHDLGATGRASDPDGWIEVSDLGPGPTLILAGGQDGHARVAREADTSTASSFELVVPRGTEVVLAGPRGDGDTFVLEDSAGLPLYSGYGLPRVVHLAPGSYTVVRSHPEGNSERYPFEVGSGRTIVRWGSR